jgi:hemoglobin/transferrin/lactoferrin receptor protein
MIKAIHSRLRKYSWPWLLLLGHGFAQENTSTQDSSPVVVIGTRTGRDWLDADGSVLQLDQQELARRGVNDLSGLVKYDPLVSVPFDFASGDGAFGYGESGYSGFNIRGVEGNRIAIELDGIRQPPQYVSTSFDQGSDGGSGGMGRDYFDPAIFNLVEVMKGGGSALYGSDAMGGVVSMRTLAAEDMLSDHDIGGLLRAQYFSVNESYAAQLGGATRSGDFDFMLLYAGRDGHETQNNGSLAPNPVDFTSSAILAKAGYAHGEHRLLLTTEFYERETDINAISATVSSFKVFDQSVLNFQKMTRERIGLQWDYEPTASWIDRLESHLYFQKSTTGSRNESRAKDVTIGGVTSPGRTRDQTIDFDTDLLGFSTLAHKEFTFWEISHQVLAGLDLSKEDNENRFFRLDSAQPQEKNRISFAPSTTERYGLFVQDEIKPDERWMITPGLRADYHQIEPSLSPAYLARLKTLDINSIKPPGPYENFTLSPRLDLSFKTTENTRLYAAYSRGIRNPTAEELSMIFDHPPSGGSPSGSLTVPNPDLEEEISHSFKTGYKGELDTGRFEISGFYTFYQNYIENGIRTGRKDDTGRDILTVENRGESEIFGFEASGEWQASTWSPKLDGLNLGLSTGKAIGINRTDDTWLNSTEPWKTVAWIGYDDPAEKFGVRLTGIYTAAVTHVDNTTNQGEFFLPPAWFTLDLSGYWKPTDTLTINAGVNNLLDEKYWSWGSVRRGNGHLGGGAVDDRSTAPGTNFYLSLTQTF